ncbi:MAG: 2-dehydropantoate 2-reductase [Clostridiales bacterium]|nr:2-dehydropantoate 2-reductase [Clostridiales bacterium]
MEGLDKSIASGQERRYLIVGAGGCGGSIGAFLARAGKYVQLIARGSHLEAMKQHGLRMETTRFGSFCTCPAGVYDEAEYIKGLEAKAYHKPDVIFVCVKYYSLKALVPFLRAVCSESTVIIPILNIYGTGQMLRDELLGCMVTDGCMYIAAEIKEPGCVVQKGDIFKIVYGVVDFVQEAPVLEAIRKDLFDSRIEGIISTDIRRDALIKFSLVSPMAACGVFYNVRVGKMQYEGEQRETFIKLVEEIRTLGRAMGIELPKQLTEMNLKLIDSLLPDACASMQRDLWQGRESEIEGILFEVPRMAQRAGVYLPVYEKIAKKLKADLKRSL